MAAGGAVTVKTSAVMSAGLDAPCVKCGSQHEPRVQYRGTFWSFPGLQFRDTPTSCVYGHCPRGEHLHVHCARCGYFRVLACAGKVLGVPVRAPQPAPAKVTTSASWWRRIFGSAQPSMGDGGFVEKDPF